MIYYILLCWYREQPQESCVLCGDQEIRQRASQKTKARRSEGRRKRKRKEGTRHAGICCGPGSRGILQVQVLVTFFGFLDLESKQPSSLTATNATSNETNEPSNQEGIKEATDQSNIPMNIHIHTLCLLFSRFVYICG